MVSDNTKAATLLFGRRLALTPNDPNFWIR